MQDRILLAIPFYNCEKQIIRVINKIDSDLLIYFNEIILINNRSIDSGEKNAVLFCERNPQMPIKVFRNAQNYGLGGSHKVAFQYAIDNDYDFVVILHGDDQGDIRDFKTIIQNREYAKFDIIWGARFMKESKLYGFSKSRIFGNKVFNAVYGCFLHMPIYELGSGLNMYKVQPLKNNYYKQFRDDLFFEVELFLAAQFYGLKVLNVPISWSELDQVSNNRVFKGAKIVFSILYEWIKSQDSFMKSEHRERVIECYTSEIVYTHSKEI